MIFSGRWICADAAARHTGTDRNCGFMRQFEENAGLPLP